MERIAEFQSCSPSFCRTKAWCYYFAVKMVLNRPDQLWFARKMPGSSSWSHPDTLTKTFGSAYVAAPHDDTVHLCWLDCRNEKHTGNAVYPLRGNYEVAYSRRRDSDPSWEKEIIL